MKCKDCHHKVNLDAANMEGEASNEIYFCAITCRNVQPHVFNVSGLGYSRPEAPKDCPYITGEHGEKRSFITLDNDRMIRKHAESEKHLFDLGEKYRKDRDKWQSDYVELAGALEIVGKYMLAFREDHEEAVGIAVEKAKAVLERAKG
jgi:hypothetical protein